MTADTGAPTGDLSAEEMAVLEAVRADFPVSWAPYCDIGERVDQPEVDVLNTVLKLRMTGHIPRLGAVFADGFEPDGDAESELAMLLQDIPGSEHPYEELHEMLEFRGITQPRDWAPDRIIGWIADGSITSFGVQDS
jgi:hypothetical protein